MPIATVARVVGCRDEPGRRPTGAQQSATQAPLQSAPASSGMHADPAGQGWPKEQAPQAAVARFPQTRAPREFSRATQPAGQAAQALLVQTVPLQQSAAVAQGWPTAAQVLQVPPAPQTSPGQQSSSEKQI